MSDSDPMNLVQTDVEALDDYLLPEDAARASYAEKAGDEEAAAAEQRTVTYGDPDDPAAPGFVSVVTGRDVDKYGALGIAPPCQHRQFLKQVTVERVESEADGTVIQWRAAVKVICAECSEHFLFTETARVSHDGQEVRVVMEPPAQG